MVDMIGVWKGAAEVEVDVMEEDEVVEVVEQQQQPEPTVIAPQVPVQQQVIQQELAAAPTNASPMSYRDRVLASTGKPPMAPAAGVVANNVGASSAPVNKEAVVYQQQATAT